MWKDRMKLWAAPCPHTGAPGGFLTWACPLGRDVEGIKCYELTPGEGSLAVSAFVAERAKTIITRFDKSTLLPMKG